MRNTLKSLAISALIGALLSCGRPESAESEHHDANTPAGKAGQAAYEAAKVTGKAAKAAGKELSKAAHDAHEGWKEAASKDKQK